MTQAKKIYGDRYEVLSLIGEGGMACVYCALDKKLDRKVALKVLHPQFANNPEIKERFYGEAKAISLLDHPNILRIYDFSGEDSEDAWLVTEILKGKTLAEFITEFSLNKMHPILATCIVKEITKALIEAHSKKIVHRDIKPENIMILKNGQIKLMDFGIAKNLKKVSMTVSGTFIGSPSYMSPEQIKGTDIDHKTDLYSLGVVFYELLTGDVPFKGQTTHEVIYKIINSPLIPPKEVEPSIPNDLNSMVVKLLAKDPEDRYKKAKNFAMDLDTFLVLNGFAESNIELERFFLNRKKFEKRLNEVMLSGWNLHRESNDETLDVSQTEPSNYKTKTVVLGKQEIEERLVNYNDNAVTRPSQNYDEISSKYVDRSLYTADFDKRYSGKNKRENKIKDNDLKYEYQDLYSDKSSKDKRIKTGKEKLDSFNKNILRQQKAYEKKRFDNKHRHSSSDKFFQKASYEFDSNLQNYKKTLTKIIGVLIVFALIALLIVGYYALQSRVDNNILTKQYERLEETTRQLEETNKSLKKSYLETEIKLKNLDTSKPEQEPKETTETKTSNSKKMNPNANRPTIKIEPVKNLSITKTNKKPQEKQGYTPYTKPETKKSLPKSSYSNQFGTKNPSRNPVVRQVTPRYQNPSNVIQKNRVEDKKEGSVRQPVTTKVNKPAGSQAATERMVAKSSGATVVKATHGELIISSRPAADIYINGVRRGTTIDQTINSGKIRLPVGTYNIELRRQGYKSYFVNVKVEGNKVKNVTKQLVRLN